MEKHNYSRYFGSQNISCNDALVLAADTLEAKVSPATVAVDILESKTSEEFKSVWENLQDSLPTLKCEIDLIRIV